MGKGKSIKVDMRKKSLLAADRDRSQRDASAAEAAGRRAMDGTAPVKLKPTLSDRALPPVASAPKGSRVIQSSHGVVAMASPRGVYLGLFLLPTED